jgi:hypothetical protein
MPASKRGYCFRIAASKVLPDRGSPEMKCNVFDRFADSGAADMRALLSMVVLDYPEAWGVSDQPHRSSSRRKPGPSDFRAMHRSAKALGPGHRFAIPR